jgi:hypothetical protein
MSWFAGVAADKGLRARLGRAVRGSCRPVAFSLGDSLRTGIRRKVSQPISHTPCCGESAAVSCARRPARAATHFFLTLQPAGCASKDATSQSWPGFTFTFCSPLKKGAGRRTHNTRRPRQPAHAAGRGLRSPAQPSELRKGFFGKLRVWYLHACADLRAPSRRTLQSGVSAAPTAPKHHRYPFPSTRVS